MTKAKGGIMLIGSLLALGSGAAMASDMVSVRALSSSCSKSVDPSTMAALVHFESGGNPYAINVNGGYRLPRQPQNKIEAIQAAKWLEMEGYNFDSGLSQININNRAYYHVSYDDLFDPCANIRVGGSILLQCYKLSASIYGEGQIALNHALSCYNTGSQVKGISNGYVRKVVQLAKATGSKELMVPALLTDVTRSSNVISLPERPESEKSVTRPKQSDGSEDAFGENGSGSPDAFDAAQEAVKPDTMAQSSHQEVVKQGKPNVQEGLSSPSTSNDGDSEERENQESRSL